MTDYNKGIITFTHLEKKYAELISLGWGNAKIAELFKVTISTVKHNIQRIMLKTGTKNRAQFVASYVGNKNTLIGSTKRLSECSNRPVLS